MNARLLGLIRRSRTAAIRRLDGLGRHPSFEPPIDTATGVVRIDDPDGDGAIVVVRGVVDAGSLRRLWDELEQLSDATTVHLDLSGAAIRRGPWMEEIGIVADALEDVGCDVRIGGVDPGHPDLRPHP